jgi:hypothetical protein
MSAVKNAADVSDSRANSARIGREIRETDGSSRVVGSTDMGNVSYLVPSIHPMIQVAPRGVPIHSPEFTGYAGGEEGDRAVIDGAKALAMTVVDLWTDAAVLAAAQEEFARIAADAIPDAAPMPQHPRP